MKLDVTQALCNFDGEPLRNETADGEPITLKQICINSLMANLDSDANMTGEEKMRAYSLGQRLHDGTVVDLVPEDLALLKERVGKCYGPVIVGPAFTMLNGDGQNGGQA